jgi:2-polyprenyl-3-methyl-5-hydroxy-6-metoxy-1,4-benzoquinol methylase
MLAKRQLDERSLAWNRKWGAPFGYQYRDTLAHRAIAKMMGDRFRLRRGGPFSIQGNSDTRHFEYPWAFHAAEVKHGLKVLEVGGGLSGLQFVLSREGCDVLNVDPGMERQGWSANPQEIARLNRAFGTSVRIMNCGIQEAELKAGSFDRVLSISVLEHVPADIIMRGMHNIHAALKPGGLCVLTVDLFLDLAPFSERDENAYGRNIPIPSLHKGLDFELALGKREELYGFPEFDPKVILGNLPTYFLSVRYPVLTQALVLRKPLA